MNGEYFRMEIDANENEMLCYRFCHPFSWKMIQSGVPEEGKIHKRNDDRMLFMGSLKAHGEWRSRPEKFVGLFASSFKLFWLMWVLSRESTWASLPDGSRLGPTILMNWNPLLIDLKLLSRENFENLGKIDFVWFLQEIFSINKNRNEIMNWLLLWTTQTVCQQIRRFLPFAGICLAKVLSLQSWLFSQMQIFRLELIEI